MGRNKVFAHLPHGLVAAAPGINQGYIQRDRQSAFPAAEWKTLCSYGMASGFLPIEAGGQGFSRTRYAAYLQELGYLIEDNGLNFALMAHSLACLWPLYLHAANENVRMLLPLFASGQNILTNAITEEHGGSDVYHMQTTAIPQGDGYVLNGSKSFCTNAPVASHALLYAVTAPQKGFYGGISVFLVDLESQGVSVGPNFEKMGLRTATASRIEFNNVYIDRSCLVGQEGGGGLIFQESMVLEKVYMAAAHTGTLGRWFEHMHDFAAKRKSGSNVILDFQSVNHMLAEIRVQLEASKALVGEAVNRLGNSSISSCIRYAAVVKYFVSNVMAASSQKYLNLFGGQGYLMENGVEVQVRDFMASTIYSGTSEIQKDMIMSGKWRE